MTITIPPFSYAIVLWMIAVGSSLTALFAARRSAPGARWLALLAAGVAIWAGFYGLELTSPDEETAYFWLRIQYFGITAIPYSWLLFSLRYTGRQVPWTLLGPLALIPLTTLGLAWTNEFHRLIWDDYSFGLYGITVDAHGLGFRLYTAASYLMFLSAMSFLIAALWRRPREFWGQRSVLTTVVLAPILANLFYIFDITESIDLSPIGFAIAVGGVAFGMIRFNVLDLVPVARDVVVETMRSGMVVLDRKKRILDVNQSARALLGQESQTLLGRPIGEVFAAGDALTGYADDLRDHDLIEHRGRWLELFFTPLGDKKRPYGKLLVMRDMTEHIETETKLRRAKEAAEAANNAKVRFLATMSHELRTPLTSILGFSELLREELVGPLNESQHDYVDNVLGSGQHLLKLINDLLTYAKLEFGEVVLDVREVVVPDLLDEIVEALTPDMRDNTLLGDYPRDLGTIYTDPIQLKELLRHLLDNAAKFTHNGTVTLVASRGAEGLRLSVHDTGIGIAPEYLADLFKVFSQADTSYTRHYGGSGVGLALVGHLCRLLGGTITVDSTLGEGSQFTVNLPTDVREVVPNLPAEDVQNVSL